MYFMKSLFATFAGFAAVGTLALAPVAFADTSATGTVSATVAAVAPVTVDVNAGGHVLVRGAVVTGVSGNVISATTSWGSESLAWSIGIASSTELLGKSGRAALADVKNGDVVSFSGSLDKAVGNLTVNARVVRDASLSGSASVSTEHGEKSHLIEGKLEAVSGNTLTLLRGNQTITVNLGANAEVKQKNFKITDLGSLKIGDHIRVLGTGTTSIDAAIVRDSSH